MGRRWLRLLVAGLVLAAGCSSDDGTGDSSDTPASGTPESTYVTQSFAMPFAVTVPTLFPSEPSIDGTHFVTWESSTPHGPAVRFLAPVNVFPPGSASTTAPPEDYLEYLLAQTEHGATFADQQDATVGELPATLLTATAREPIDGSLGCPETDMSAGDCFGLQPGLRLRMAVIDAGDRTLLAWLRHDDSTGDPSEEFASFEEMLASLTFREADRPTSTDTAAASSPIDGVWSTSITFEELESSALLYDADEVNDENWGDLTFTFEGGRFTLDQTNPRATSSYSGTFEVDGDVLSMTMEAVEHLEMRWSINGDQLTLTRDESLGISPTPWVIKSWTRAG